MGAIDRGELMEHAEVGAGQRRGLRPLVQAGGAGLRALGGAPRSTSPRALTRCFIGPSSPAAANARAAPRSSLGAWRAVRHAARPRGGGAQGGARAAAGRGRAGRAPGKGARARMRQGPTPRCWAGALAHAAPGKHSQTRGAGWQAQNTLTNHQTRAPLPAARRGAARAVCVYRPTLPGRARAPPACGPPAVRGRRGRGAAPRGRARGDIEPERGWAL